MPHFALLQHLEDVIDRSDIRVTTEGLRPIADQLDRRFADLRPSLVRVCASLVGPEEAEDAAQDAYLRARRSVRQLRDTATLDAWLYRIAVNVCYGWHRRRRHLSSTQIDPETRDKPARDVGLVQLIERLPPRERTILVLHYGHGYGLDEIAVLLGMKHVTVRSVISRTRRQLAVDLEEAAR
jgi:RNA polymerase sigma-70 factor (ECF subfamily)